MSVGIADLSLMSENGRVDALQNSLNARYMHHLPEDSFEQLSQTTTLRGAASSALLPLRRDFPASFVGDGGLPQTLPQGAQC